MECIYCAHKTRVTNSRSTKSPHGIWRRRLCTSCGAIFTTREYAELSTGVAVLKNDHDMEPLDRDRLLTSVYDSCKHRSDAAQVAGPLTDTIIQKALAASTANGLVDRTILTAEAHQALQRFDTYAANHYEAYFMKRA